jgi:Tol biopolymer transport system component
MDHWDRIEHVYHGARDLEGTDRVRFLDQQCGSNAAMRRHVEALLAQDDTPDSFLNRPVVDVAAGWRSLAEHLILRAGSAIGPYEVVEPVGAGGMGEVYRARDTKLGRDVALKVLPEGFSLDRDRLARFTREAQVLASLNHPNIAAIYELEDASGVQALVLEFVEGPTLAERISRGAMLLDEALPIVRQIADALEAAHARGIIHRDLKPSNVKVRPDGTVKILDFGLAKTLESVVTPEGSSDPATVTSPGITRQDIVLGTAPYMSPEQARGRPVDQRADIWAFGVVLYEMLTGRQPFVRPTIPDTLAAVLKEDPDWTIVPLETGTLLRRCLEKNPARRLRHIGDALPLLGLREGPVSDVRRRRGETLAWWGFVVFGALAVILAIGRFREVKSPADAIRFQVPLPDRVAHGRALFAVSPNGREIAMASTNGGPYWLRTLDTLESRELTGTETTSGAWPFWSPDSRFLVFDAVGALKKIDIAGGPAQTVCGLRTRAIGGSMNGNGAIIFGSVGGIMRVSENGDPTALTRLDASRHETAHSYPVFLADGRHFLYLRESENPDDSKVYIGALDAGPADQSARPVVSTRYGASYVPPASGDRGQVLFVRQGTLLDQPFDERTLSVTGDPVPIADHIETYYNAAFFSVSRSTTGVLVFKGASLPYQLTWLDAHGRPQDPVGEPDFYDGLALSSDATKAAVSQQGFLWLLDLRRGGARTRFAVGLSPVWAPDGSRLAFSSLRAGRFALFSKALSGSPEEALGPSSSSRVFGPTSWSHDGRFLLYTDWRPTTKSDVWVLPLDGTRQPKPLLATEFNEDWGAFSPDGRWIAYMSDESGRNEMYVKAVSSTATGLVLGETTWLISEEGTQAWPLWRSDSKQLSFITLDKKIMTVDVTSTRVAPFSEPHELFTLPFPSPLIAFTGDMHRALVAAPPATQNATGPITVVVNWPALRRK